MRKRLFYAAASPLIPLVRFARIVGGLLAPGRPSALLWRCGPLLMLGLICDGMGQFAGYLAGAGHSAATLSNYEFNRIRFITEADRHQLDSEDA